MTFIYTGCLAFVFFYIFDLNKIRFINKSINISFGVGIALLAVSTMGVLLGNYKHIEVSVPLSLLFGALSISSLLMVFYSLFYALSFRNTYMEVEEEKAVIDSGMYALCRHPAVIWFFFFYLFLWLASGKVIMMWAGIIWTIMDIIYVYVEDRWFFPKTLNGYDQYKSTVPFLIPNSASIKRCIFTMRGIRNDSR